MVGISNFITSFCTYFQNLGASISASSLNLPPSFTKIMNAVSQFLNTLARIIPSIPAFDIRAQLVIMSILIPFILDVFFVWFLSPIGQIVSHMIDLLILGFGSFYLAQSLIFEWTTGTVLIVSLTLIYAVLRILIKVVCRTKGKSSQLIDIASKISLHFLYGIDPSIDSNPSIKEIKYTVRRYSTFVEIAPSKARPCPMITKFIFASILLIISLMCIDVIPIDNSIPSGLCVFFPYIGFPFSFFLFLNFFLHLCHTGRKVLNSIKNFCKRWGLRLLMLIFDLLYIPILTYLIANIFPKKIGCSKGEYLYYDRGYQTKDIWFSYVNHTSRCIPCWPSLMNTSEICNAQCNGKKELRMADAPNLLFLYDEIYTLGGVFIYNIIAIMIGIPLLWGSIVSRNASVVNVVSAYGNDLAEKWYGLVNKMKTTGIFLFCNYKSQYTKWTILLQMVKLGVMIINALSQRISSKISIVLSIWYLVVVIAYLKIRPYLYSFNNVVDPILYFSNFLITIIPFLASCGHPISGDIATPLSYIIIAIPVASLIFLFCCRSGPSADEDPTVVPKKKKKNDKIHDEEIEYENYVNHPPHHHHHHHHHRSEEENAEQNEEEELQPLENSDSEVEFYDDQLLVDGWDRPFEYNEELFQARCRALDQPDFDEDEDEEETENETVELQPCQLMSINNFKWFTDAQKNGNVPSTCVQKFTVKKKVLQNRFKHMYDMIDIVTDGSTIEFLTSNLNLLVMGAAMAFGWYLGATNGFRAKAEDVFCG